MNSLGAELRDAVAQDVRLDDDLLTVDIADGRTLSVPIVWFLRLSHATPAERSKRQLIGPGTGIHWPDLDEDISVRSILAGQPSAESQESLQRWLSQRDISA